MNTVNLTGNLTRQPVAFEGDEDKKAKTYLTIACDRPGADSGTDFISIACFGKLAETVAAHKNKGDLVAVTGHLNVSSYLRDDETIYTTEVIAERIDFL